MASQNDWKMVAGAGLAVLVVGLGAAIRIRRKRRAAAKQKPVAQEEHPTFPMEPPGKGAPLFRGIRVIELATVVAAPSACRQLAELGAEVIKVEDTNGDYWRKFFREYEAGREDLFGCAFETANFNKSSIQLELKSSEGLKTLKDLLKQADVFITNLKLSSLRTLGLDYESIADEMPHLVYAHLSAWGRSGEGGKLPGYDLGAFWTATGASAMINREGCHSMYPVAFGDATTGSNLVGSISLSLLHRLQTGEGHLVDAALFRTGLWCVSPHIIKAQQNTPDRSSVPLVPKYTPATLPDIEYQQYNTSDGKMVCVVGFEDKSTRDKICGVVGVSSEDPKALDAAKRFFLKLTVDEAAEVLKKAKVPVVKSPGVCPPTEAHHSDMYGPPVSSALTACPGVTDVRTFVKIPYDASCSLSHGVVRRAPQLGAHTQSFLRKGFSKRHEAAELPMLNPGQTPKKGPAKILEGVVVVELADWDCSVPSATALLSGYGATVIKVEPKEGDVWRRRDPALFKQLNRGKHSVTCDVARGEDPAVVRNLLSRAHAFVTNFPKDVLKKAGLDYDTVHARHKELVYAQVTPFGMDFDDSIRGDLAAFWTKTGFGLDFRGSYMPEQFGALVSSFHIFASISAGLFHQARVNEGQLMTSSLLRCGMYSAMTSWCVMEKDPTKRIIFEVPDDLARHYFPVPTALSHRTKDGMWVQLLGVELPKHLMKTLKAFGIATPTILKTLYVVVTQILPSKEPSKFLRFRPLFETLNLAIEKAIAKVTYQEFLDIAEKYDIWYAPINMPEQLVGENMVASQARSTGAVRDDGTVGPPTHLHPASTVRDEQYSIGVLPEAYTPSRDIPSVGDFNSRVASFVAEKP